MIKYFLATRANKKLAKETAKKQIMIITILALTGIVRQLLQKLEHRFPHMTFLSYRKYIGL